MGFQDLAFLLSRASLPTTFLKNCGRGESLGKTTCPKTPVGVDNGMLPVKYFCSNKAFFVSVKFNEDHKTAYIDEAKSGHPQFWGYYRI